MNTLLQINAVVNTGSTGHIAEEIGRTALARGWKSYIAYGRYGQPSKSELIRIGTDWDVRYHGLQTRLFDRHGLSSGRATSGLIEKIEKIKPDLIHLHNLHGYYIHWEILFDYLSTALIPVVWTLHDCWAFTGHCAYFDFVQCDKWKIECGNCPQKTTYPATWMVDRTTENYRQKKKSFTSVPRLTIVAVSRWLSTLAKDSFLSTYPIQVIYNGVDTDFFCERASVKKKYGIDNKFMILGVANQWTPRKGLEDFVELSERLDTQSVILLVGLSEAQKRRLPSRIIGLGRTENSGELAALYASADVFFNPTWEDNFPTTNLESLACGTPVITYRTGGSPEAITPETGFIVEKGDLHAALSIVEKVKKQGKEYYSQACRERAVEWFRKEERYAEYLDLYESLLVR